MVAQEWEDTHRFIVKVIELDLVGDLAFDGRNLPQHTSHSLGSGGTVLVLVKVIGLRS